MGSTVKPLRPLKITLRVSPELHYLQRRAPCHLEQCHRTVHKEVDFETTGNESSAQ